MVAPHESRIIAAEIVRLQRREKWYSRWKMIALLAVFSLIVMLFSTKHTEQESRHLAVVNVSGMITQESDIWRQLNKINKNTQGVMVLLNSGGGTVGSSERLYNHLKLLSESMPIEVLIEDQATSGAYLAALASDKIYAYNASIIGSIGVLMQSFNVEQLFETYGVRVDTYTTGKYKGYPSPFRETPEDVQSHLMDVMLEDNEWFISLVKSRRNLNQSLGFDQAEVYTSRKAVSLGLIDGISTRAESMNRLKSVAGDWPVYDLEVDDSNYLLKNIFGKTAQHLPDVLSKWQLFALF
ncbi:signal peptide peptidase SppA [Gammaproteobacteria bacterium]|nr:signal peptide peptidase SppA [Gammaproteobacteria bacterium]